MTGDATGADSHSDLLLPRLKHLQVTVMLHVVQLCCREASEALRMGESYAMQLMDEAGVKVEMI